MVPRFSYKLKQYELSAEMVNDTVDLIKTIIAQDNDKFKILGMKMFFATKDENDVLIDQRSRIVFQDGDNVETIRNNIASHARVQYNTDDYVSTLTSFEVLCMKQETAGGCDIVRAHTEYITVDKNLKLVVKSAKTSNNNCGITHFIIHAGSKLKANTIRTQCGLAIGTMLTPKELNKVADIFGIPFEIYDNMNRLLHAYSANKTEHPKLELMLLADHYSKIVKRIGYTVCDKCGRNYTVNHT